MSFSRSDKLELETPSSTAKTLKRTVSNLAEVLAAPLKGEKKPILQPAQKTASYGSYSYFGVEDLELLEEDAQNKEKETSRKSPQI